MSEPLFSIVIPTRDRPARLAECLDAIGELRLRHSYFEVVVVDDGSRQPVEPRLAPFRGRLNLTVLRESGRGPAAARNAGAGAAKGRFLAFTDDDCAPAPDWLERFESVFAIAGACLVGGRTVNALAHNCFSEASQLLVSYLYDYFNADRVRFLTSNNMAVSAEQYRAFGGFDEGFPRAAAEDRDFCDRWIRSGRLLSYAPGATVFHRHSLTAAGYLQQHLNYGRGAYQYHSIRGLRHREPIRIEPLRFYTGLVGYPFRQEARRPLLLATLLAASQIANATGFLVEWAACRKNA